MPDTILGTREKAVNRKEKKKEKENPKQKTSCLNEVLYPTRDKTTTTKKS